MSFVFTTFGGRRFHDGPDCLALDLGRCLSGARYEPRVRTPEDAARAGFTACRVCVPPALALPDTGETYGHEPVRDPIAGAHGWPQFPVCARCSWGRVYYAGSLRREPVHVAWPCTSAVVLGLVVTDADRWNARYPVGSQVRAWPASRADKPLRTRTRTPAWRLAHGASVVSVDGHAGGILLTHVEAL